MKVEHTHTLELVECYLTDEELVLVRESAKTLKPIWLNGIEYVVYKLVEIENDDLISMTLSRAEQSRV